MHKKLILLLILAGWTSVLALVLTILNINIIDRTLLTFGLGILGGVSIWNFIEYLWNNLNLK